MDRRACRIKGGAEIHHTGAIHEDMVVWVRETRRDAPAEAAVMLNVANAFVCHGGADRGKDVALA